MLVILHFWLAFQETIVFLKLRSTFLATFLKERKKVRETRICVYAIKLIPWLKLLFQAKGHRLED